MRAKVRAARGGTREGVWHSGGAKAACVHTRRLRLKRLGGTGTRGAHPEHVAHGCDAGRVEAQRLVEGRRALPSRKGGHTRCGPRCGPGGAGGRAAQRRCKNGMCVHAEALFLRLTRRAHPEHDLHVRDAGRVEAQRLVESKRLLPSRKGGACDVRRGEEVRPGRREGVRCGGVHGEGMRRAHVEHAAHVCDAGRVEAQRLVEGRRVLPSRKGGHRRVWAEVCGRAVGAWRRECDTQREAVGARAHPEHRAHVRDAGGIPAGYVRVEVLQEMEEVAHVGDG